MLVFRRRDTPEICWSEDHPPWFLHDSTSGGRAGSSLSESRSEVPLAVAAGRGGAQFLMAGGGTRHARSGTSGTRDKVCGEIARSGLFRVPVVRVAMRYRRKAIETA
jgi:hypothetical protein